MRIANADPRNSVEAAALPPDNASRAPRPAAVPVTNLRILSIVTVQNF